MKIKIIKFNDELKMPTRGHYNDAGIDCYALEDFEIQPMRPESLFGGFDFAPENNTAVISLGFGLEVPDGYMATIRPRSSMNIKGIVTQIGTIDSGYRGEIKAAFCNLTKSSYKIKKGDKICQIVVEPVILVDVVEDLNNDRGTGGFGSTGK